MIDVKIITTIQTIFCVGCRSDLGRILLGDGFLCYKCFGAKIRNMPPEFSDCFITESKLERRAK